LRKYMCVRPTFMAIDIVLSNLYRIMTLTNVGARHVVR